MNRDLIVKLLICLSLCSFVWIIAFFLLGEYDQIVLRDMKEIQIKVEQNPQYSNICSLECFQKNLYCMSEFESKILVYDLEGKYLKTIQLPYSSTGQNTIAVNNKKLYIDCATGDKYEYDGKHIIKYKSKDLSYQDKQEVVCNSSRYYIKRNKLLKEKSNIITVIKSESFLLWAVRNAEISLLAVIILFISLFFVKKLS